ncbi:hypothetical protein BGZ60DRAFT_553745 [Tricladium varicosporioides]|nr:hypothetical protein BGZ60DRAFT_553745 [Hymenoscyphus varicosporioides]
MPWGPVGEIDRHDTCVFCYAPEPQEEHNYEHAIQPCYNASMTDRIFASKGAFQLHLITVHGQDRINSIIHEWKVPVSDDSYYWNCGFCGTINPNDGPGSCDILLSTWTGRMEHIGEHFNSGTRISLWDPHRPPHPLDRVTVTCAAWFPALTWELQTLWDIERNHRCVSWPEEEYKCEKCNNQISFKIQDDRDRHDFIWHTRRGVWVCPTIREIKASFLACHFFRCARLLYSRSRYMLLLRAQLPKTTPEGPSF